jgi:hypothetical protein
MTAMLAQQRQWAIPGRKSRGHFAQQSSPRAGTRKRLPAAVLLPRN